jgi:hypothetical protein
LELESFLQAVRGQHPVEVDGEAGLRALHLALALVTSATGSRVIAKPELDALWGSGGTLGGVGHPKPGRAHRDDL